MDEEERNILREQNDNLEGRVEILEQKIKKLINITLD